MLRFNNITQPFNSSFCKVFKFSDLQKTKNLPQLRVAEKNTVILD